uniref:Protein FAR1-RELATED SEQUENCE n=1 Tax=Arundo donax TaxID=35708 RepID=A0A0A9D608_ARUDO
MTNTQRSESTNAVLKGFVPRNSPLNLFLQQYTKLVQEQESMDHEKEKNNKQRVVKLKFGWPIEPHAVDIYTFAGYDLFVEELQKTTGYLVVATLDSSVYKIVHVNSDRREKWSKVEFVVSIDQESSHYNCECGLYNHFGILCSHALLLMVQKGVKEIPPVHIMDRWTRPACVREAPHLLPPASPSAIAVSNVFRHNQLTRTCRQIEKLVESDEEDYDYAMKHLGRIVKFLQAKKDAVRTNCQVGFDLIASDSEAGNLSDSARQAYEIVDSRTGIVRPFVRRSIVLPVSVFRLVADTYFVHRMIS